MGIWVDSCMELCGVAGLCEGVWGYVELEEVQFDMDDFVRAILKHEVGIWVHGYIVVWSYVGLRGYVR